MRLEAENISFNYAMGKVLHNFSLTLKPGDFTMILGPNGSGKSTALKLLAGFLLPTTGDVRLNDKPLKSMPNRERARLLAVVTQSSPPVLDYTVAEMVMMGRQAHLPRLSPPAEEDCRIVKTAMGQLGLLHLQNRNCNQLSGGERQRVAIAVALAQQPRFLLLDEPTSALDPAHAFNIMEILKSQSATLGILMISHDLNLAMRYGKHVFLLQQGVIKAFGSPLSILTAPNIEEVYQCQAKVLHSEAESCVYLMPSK